MRRERERSGEERRGDEGEGREEERGRMHTNIIVVSAVSVDECFQRSEVQQNEVFYERRQFVFVFD